MKNPQDKNQNITIYDIAEKAGVSPTTVSRILNNKSTISEKTKKRVQAVMKELNYFPNQLARGLQKENHSSVIGVVLPNIANPFFSALVQHIDISCNDRGYKMLLCTAAQETDSEEEYARILKAYGVAGILLRSRFNSSGAFDEIGLPVVSLEVNIPGIPCVSCDNYEGGRLAARTLVQSGSRNPLLFTETGTKGNAANERTDGFFKGCEELGVQGRIVALPREMLLNRDCIEEVKKLFEQYPDTDGIFAPSDILAARVTMACFSIGKKVPEDVQVIGFDGTYIAKTFGTTTIVQPLQDMSDFAIDLLIRKIEGGNIPIRSTLPVTVQQGNTTRDPQE